MPEVSIILPSLRPDLLEVTLRHVFAHTKGVDFEVVVVSPFRIEGTRIRHVLETEARGSVHAQGEGYRHARGGIIVNLVDDHLPRPGWLDGAAAFLAEKEKAHFPFAAGLHRHDRPFFGTVYGLYYPYFPVMTRRSVEAAGGWHGGGGYVAHFSDPDLGMRVWSHGGRCELLPGPGIVANADEDPATQSPYKLRTLEADFRTFMDRYHPAYGAGFLPEWRNVNFDYHISELHGNSFTRRLPPHVYNGRPWDWAPEGPA